MVTLCPLPAKPGVHATRPSGMALKLLNIVEKHGLKVLA